MATLQDLLIKVGIDPKGVDKGTGQIESKFERTWGRVQATAAIAGAAIAAAVGTAVVTALDVEAAGDKLAAQLGASAQESEQLGKIAGSLYADAYGDSIGTVNNAVGAVVTSIEGMRGASSAAIEDMTAKALDFATAFEVDVARAAQVAGQAVSSGLARDGTHAMDLLTASMQKVPAAVREDLVDAVDEYGPFLASIGVQGERAFGLLVKGAEKGMYGIDKTGDALKEFTIRATDMSTASKAGYDALGMSQEQMSRRLLKGGADGAKAFEQIIAGLQRIKDPVKQSQAALALFGTPLEDLSVTEIPKFLAGLQATSSGLGKVDGAAAKMGQTLNDNDKAALTAFKRGAEQKLIAVLGKTVRWIEENQGAAKVLAGVIGGTLATVAIAKFVMAAAGAVKAAATGVAALARWTAAGVRWAATMVASAARATASFAATVARTVVGWVVMAAGAMANAVVMAAAWFIALGPVGWVIAGVVALIAIFVALWLKFEGFRNFWIGAWDLIWGAIQWVWGWIKSNWPLLLAIITGPIGMAVWLINKYWDQIKAGAGAVWRWITDKFTALVGFFRSIPGKISGAARGMFNGLVTAFKSAINRLISLWNGFSLTLGGGSVLGMSVPSVTLSTPNIPYLAEGGIVPATPGGRLAVIGEGGRDEAVVPLPRGAREFARNGGGGSSPIILQGDGSRIMALLIEMLRLALRNRGAGNGLDAVLAPTR